MIKPLFYILSRLPRAFFVILIDIYLYSRIYKLFVSYKITKINLKIAYPDLNNLNKIAYKVKYKSTYKFNKKLKKAVDSLNLTYLNKTKLICSDKHKKCNVYDKKNKELYIFDNHHWTFNGAKYFGSKIDLSNL